MKKRRTGRRLATQKTKSYSIPWYRKVFGEDYLKIYPHRNGPEASLHVDFAIEKLHLLSGQRVLDLGCGNGRHSIRLAEKGLRVVGLDLSNFLLRLAENSARTKNLPVHFIRGDMRQIPFPPVFDAVCSFFTSFGYFDAEEENSKVIQSVASTLVPGGLFFLDFFNVQYTLSHLVRQDSSEKNGIRLVQRRKFNERTFRIEKKIVIHESDRSREYRESVRAYGGAEIGSLFADAGLTCIATYGDYDGTPFNQNSPRLIMIGRKGG